MEKFKGTKGELKPILFNQEMVEAILDGRKTQTRRPIYFRKKIKNPTIGFTVFCDFDEYAVRGIHENGSCGDSLFKLPAKVEDTLWVRETFAIENGNYIYKAGGGYDDNIKWKPSIHMPLKAARIFLKITRVRIEKLNDISELDSHREGLNNDGFFYIDYLSKNKERRFMKAKESFVSLWKSIYKDSEENPYLFAWDFKVIDKPKYIL